MNVNETEHTAYDPVGTSHAFAQVKFHAAMLVWDFEEQIAGAPRELLEQWRDAAEAAELAIAEIKRELETRT